MRKLLAAFFHSEQHVQPWNYFTGMFDASWAQSEGVPASFRHLWWNMDPLEQTRGKEQYTSNAPRNSKAFPSVGKRFYYPFNVSADKSNFICASFKPFKFVNKRKATHQTTGHLAFFLTQIKADITQQLQTMLTVILRTI